MTAVKLGGGLADIRQDLASELQQVGVIDGSEAPTDASFARAKDSGADMELAKAGKGVRIMVIVDR